jgi:hypothetical protein
MKYFYYKNKRNFIYLLYIIIFLIILYYTYTYTYKNKNIFENFNNTNDIKKSNTYIFYHIFCNSNTYTIVNDQINKIIFSGLYKKIDKIYVFLTGDKYYINDIEKLIKKSGKKFIIADIGINDKSYERFTLLKIKKYIDSNDKFLYMHSKGVSKDNNKNKIENIQDWRNMMEYFLIHNFEECINLLDNYDVVGINYIKNLHFSGNFWWTKASYFKKLPNKIPNYYTAPEDYICKSNPKIKVLYSSGYGGFGHYKKSYPYSKYIDQNN